MAATRPQSILRWSRYLFFIIGVLALGYCGFGLLDANFYKPIQIWRFQPALKGSKPSAPSGERLSPPPPPTGSPEAVHASLRAAVPIGSPLGRIEISKLGVTAMIAEGVDEGTLRRAVGHIPGTPLPGEQGNVAIAGHRDTFFRALRNIHKDDEITLTTLGGSYRYRVESIRVVRPQDTEVLDASSEGILTLVTCYPFYFVGAAPKRFIVRAHRASDSKGLLAESNEEKK
jgi:sortase A